MTVKSRWKLLVALAAVVVAVGAANVLAWSYFLTREGAAVSLTQETGRRFVALALFNAFFWTAFMVIAAAVFVRRVTLPLARANASLASDVRRSERLAALGTLSAGLAHELNNLLNNIHGYTRVLERETGDKEPYKSDLAIIKKECRRAAELIQRYLMFARPSRLEPSRITVEGVLDPCIEVLDLAMTSQNIVLVRRIAAGLPELECDPVLIEQALFNVLLNSIQAMKSGGTLTVGAQASEGTIVLTVEDTGSGIPPELLSRVFDPFFSTKSPGEGTGLGLAITHRIVEQHSGAIRIESAPPRGTCVTIELPAAGHASCGDQGG